MVNRLPSISSPLGLINAVKKAYELRLGFDKGRRTSAEKRYWDSLAFC